MRVRAIRGAIQVQADEAPVISAAVVKLLGAIVAANQIQSEDLVSVHFTSTPDLIATFPATAARSLDYMLQTPLISSVEVAVSGSLPRTIRVLVHAYSELEKSEISHIYLDGAQILRPDLQTK